MLQILFMVYIPWMPLTLIGDSPASARELYLQADSALRSHQREPAITALYNLIQQFPETQYAAPAVIRIAELELAAGGSSAAAELLISWLPKSEAIVAGELSSEDAQTPQSTQAPPSTLHQPLEDAAETHDRLKRLLVTAISQLSHQELQELYHPIQAADNVDRNFAQAAILRELARRASQAGELIRTLELLEQLGPSATERERDMRNFNLPMAVLRKSSTLQEVFQIQQRLNEWDTMSLSQRCSLKLTLAEAFRRLGDHGSAMQILHELARDLAGESLSITESQGISESTDISHELKNWRASVDLRRAELLFASGDRRAAAELLEKSVSSYPEFSLRSEFHFLLARHWIAEIDFDRARGELQTILQTETISSGSRAKAIWMMGEIDFMKRDFEAAFGNYSQVASMTDQPQWQARSLLQMGKCLELQNRVSDAMPLYQRIVQDFADSEVAQFAAQRLELLQHSTAAKRLQSQLPDRGSSPTPGKLSNGIRPEKVR